MKKFDVFFKSPRARKWRVAFTLFGTDAHQVASVASSRLSGNWIKVLPSIIML